MREIDEIIVHCTATRPNWWSDRSAQEKVDEVRRWHVDDNGWSDVGYHWLIDRDGTVVKGRDESRTGAHVRGHNATSIGVSLFGGHGGTNRDAFEANFTPAQDAALRRLIGEIERRHDIKKISGHNEYANKACPCFDVRAWLQRRPPAPARTSPAQSNTVRASAAQLGTAAAGGVTAVAALDGQAQVITIALFGVIALAALWIMRERLRKWANGDR